MKYHLIRNLSGTIVKKKSISLYSSHANIVFHTSGKIVKRCTIVAARIKNICRIFPKGLIMITLHKPLHVDGN